MPTEEDEGCSAGGRIHARLIAQQDGLLSSFSFPYSASQIITRNWSLSNSEVREKRTHWYVRLIIWSSCFPGFTPLDSLACLFFSSDSLILVSAAAVRSPAILMPTDDQRSLRWMDAFSARVAAISLFCLSAFYIFF